MMLILGTDNFCSKIILILSILDKIIKKGLKNPDYFRVLGIIGESEEPLSNVQILQNL